MKTIILTEQDLILVFRLHLIKNSGSHIFKMLTPLRWYLILIGILFLVISIYLGKHTRYESISHAIHYLGLLFLLSFTLSLWPFLAKYTAKSTWRTNKILHHSYIITWDQNNLYTRSDIAENKYKWSAYCQTVQDENYILAYYQQNILLIIPKRSFESTEEMQDFLNHLESGIKTNKESTY